MNRVILSVHSNLGNIFSSTKLERYPESEIHESKVQDPPNPLCAVREKREHRAQSSVTATLPLPEQSSIEFRF